MLVRAGRGWRSVLLLGCGLAQWARYGSVRWAGAHRWREAEETHVAGVSVMLRGVSIPSTRSLHSGPPSLCAAQSQLSVKGQASSPDPGDDGAGLLQVD